LHCGILNHPIPRCKGWLGVCPAWSAVGESIQSNCPLRLSFEAAELGPGGDGQLSVANRQKPPSKSCFLMSHVINLPGDTPITRCQN